MAVLNNKVFITVNGVKVRCNQGTNSFQDLIATAVEVGAASKNSKLATVVTAAATQNSTFGPNQSYVVSGGEVFTVA